MYVYVSTFDNLYNFILATPMCGRPDACYQMIHQQGAGFQENPGQSEDAGLKAKLKIHTSAMRDVPPFPDFAQREIFQLLYG